MNGKTKTLILLLLATVASTKTYAQGSDNLTTFYNSFLPDFQKLTPEASALGRYGAYDVSGFTGVPNIIVPLFTIESGGFSMPVELSYDASGIKVEQDATYVGLGWNLVMGGSISHIVCGENDFSSKSLVRDDIPNVNLYDSLFYFVNLSYNSYTHPMACNEHVDRTNSQPVVGGGEYGIVEEDKYKDEILRNVYAGYSIPDIFQASFCGHSLSFTIDVKSQNARILGEGGKKYKIELSYDIGELPKTITITDDHGVKYEFTAYNEYSGSDFKGVSDDASYLLTQVKNAAETLITFTYSRKGTYNLKNAYYETMGKTDNVISPQVYNLFVKRNQPPANQLSHTIAKYYPATIETKRETVTFEYADRTDIVNAKSMKRILVKSKASGNTIHNTSFNFGYFNENSAREDINTSYHIYPNYDGYYIYNSTRLKLEGITIDGKEYEFGYDESSSLPSRLSLCQDFWGYYNGQENTEGFCASPKYKDTESQPQLIEPVGSANRFALPSLCRVGTLNRISYPTGGYTTFNFEVHHFDDVSGKYYYPPADSKIGKTYQEEEAGIPLCHLSIAQQYGQLMNQKFSTEFVVSEPVTATIVNHGFDPTIPSEIDIHIKCKDANSSFTERSYGWSVPKGTSVCCEYSIELPVGNYILSGTFKRRDNKPGIIGTTVTIYGPPTVKDYQEVISKYQDPSGKSIGGGLRIKSINNYDSDGTLFGRTEYEYEKGILQIPTVRKETIYLEDSYSLSGSPNSANMYSTLYNCILFVNSNPPYPTICSYGSPNVGYSKVTKKHYGKNGQLLSYDIEEYNNSGYKSWEDMNMFHVNVDSMNGKIKRTTTYASDNTIMRQVDYGYKRFGTSPRKEDVVFYPWCRLTTMSSALYGHKNYKYSIYPKYPVSVFPSFVTERNYVNGIAMKPVTTSYSYLESNFQPTSVSKSSETGNFSTTYWYPGDANVSSSNTKVLTDPHCISEIVMTKQYKNNTLIGGYRNEYSKLSNGLPVVSKKYSIQSNNNEILELDIISHDAYGNIREYKKKDGTPVTIIWSYNHQHPVLEIVGCTYSELTANTDASRIISNLEGKEDVSIEDMRKWHGQLQSMTTTPRLCTAYLYSPWHTLSYVIMPNGHETRYDYDGAGRLETINEFSVGKQTHIPLKQIEYNYIVKP